MGEVIDVSVSDEQDGELQSLHVYAHCSAESEKGPEGVRGVTVLLVNVDEELSYAVSLDAAASVLLDDTTRLEYHITSASSPPSVWSKTVKLNERPLLVEDG